MTEPSGHLCLWFFMSNVQLRAGDQSTAIEETFYCAHDPAHRLVLMWSHGKIVQRKEMNDE